METRKCLAKIVLVFVCCFVFCWFPNHILYMYRSFNYNEIDPSLGHMIVTLVARVLSFCSSCVNPFALYLLSESFRRHFNSQLCCGRKSYRETTKSYQAPTYSAPPQCAWHPWKKNLRTWWPNLYYLVGTMWSRKWHCDFGHSTHYLKRTYSLLSKAKLNNFFFLLYLS